MVDRATEKVQSLALAKIEQRQRAAAPARAMPNPSITSAEEAVETAPAITSRTLLISEDEVLAKAKAMMQRRAEEKAQAIEDKMLRKGQEERIPCTRDATEQEEDEAPWLAFHASYMRAEEMTSERQRQAQPEESMEKIADKSLKLMEKGMKSWEERMKKAAESDVAVTDGQKLLEGGFLEALVHFTGDSDKLSEDQESVLRTVAATVRMRHKLHLQLVGCGVELDGPVAVMRRLCNVQQFFESDGICCKAIHAVRSGNNHFIPSTQAPTNRQSRYVLCRLHMNDDMELCGHLLGTLPSSKKKTREQAPWLKSNFEIITY
jgi:hypothetical protein